MRYWPLLPPCERAVDAYRTVNDPLRTSVRPPHCILCRPFGVLGGSYFDSRRNPQTWSRTWPEPCRGDGQANTDPA